MTHLSGLDAAFTSASISYPGSPLASVIKSVAKLTAPTIASSNVLNP